MSRPLAGRRVLVLRPEEPGPDRLVEGLRARGAEVPKVPAIRIVPPADPGPLAKATRTLVRGGYAWLVVTSRRAIPSLLEAVAGAGGRPEGLDVRVAAVGRSTRRALEEAGLPPEVVPDEGGAAGLCATLLRTDGPSLEGARVLFPASQIARRTVETELGGAGARVDRVVAYRTLETEDAEDALRRVLADPPDRIAVTSPSTARRLAAALEGGEEDLHAAIRAVSIGPTTSGSLRDLGIEPVAEASPHDMEGLVEAVVRSVEAPRTGS